MKTAQYLHTTDPVQRKAFFDGFRTAMSVLASTDSTEYAHVLSHRSDEWITYLVAQLEEQQANDQQATISHLIDRYGFDKAMFRAFMLGCEAVNDAGIEIDPLTGAPIENDYFRLIDDQQHHPYRSCKIMNPTDPSETIPYAAYAALSATERQRWCCAPWFDLLHNGIRIVRINGNDETYIAELLRRDIAIGDPIIDRYICETGSSCIHRYYLSPGRLYAYRDTVAEAIAELVSDIPYYAVLYPASLLAQIRNGDINSYGQFKLAQCLNLLNTVKLSAVRQQIFLLMRPLLDLLKFRGTDETLPDWLTQHDIIGYRDVNRCAFYGAAPEENNVTQTHEGSYVLFDNNVASAESLLYYLYVAPLYRLAHRIKQALSMTDIKDKVDEEPATTGQIGTAMTPTPKTTDLQTNDVVILRNDPQFLEDFWSQMDEVNELIQLCNAITDTDDRLPIQDTIDKVRNQGQQPAAAGNETKQPS